jgi:hypothetical protein
MREQGIVHPIEKCISIPRNDSLIADLSLPLVFRTEGGKIQLESKIMMAKRGVRSPDFGDAAAYTMTGNGVGGWKKAAQTLQRHRVVSAFEGMD